VAETGKEWREKPFLPFEAPKRVQALWQKLWDAGTTKNSKGNAEIFCSLSATDHYPKWWETALELMLIADEAVHDEVGWVPIAKLREAWLPVASLAVREQTDRRGLLSTIAFETNQDMANVLPKARTPAVGCTLRSLSHHLSLLPPRGVARAYWVSPVEHDLPSSDALNLLLVPFPYSLPAKSFKAKTPIDLVREREWGWFELNSTWLDDLHKDDLVDWLKQLVRQAERDCSEIHGIVLPELALNWDHYERIVAEFKRVPHFEILISGLCKDDTGREGNFVATTQFGRQSNETTTRIREKHHRWKLDGPQISRYALSSALQPTARWWEKLDIISRSLDVFVFRKDSCLTTLICEDLARVDPSQELVRSIGPNLVVALLMDAAQVKGRWPARYATVLADDPGSGPADVLQNPIGGPLRAWGFRSHRQSFLKAMRPNPSLS
jgi:hypothetical protein